MLLRTAFTRRISYNIPHTCRASARDGKKRLSTASDASSDDVVQRLISSIKEDPKVFEKVWLSASNTTRAEIIKPILANMPPRVAVNEFVRADKSQDGVLNRQEFEHWLTTTLKRAATRSPEAIGTATKSATNEVTREQLKKLAVMSAIPFVGFGFLDNAVMITAGSQIDAAFSAFGISAMAAAGLGNTVSDVAGIKAGGFIEMAA